MFYTTLNKIREQGPCLGGWRKLLEHLGKTKADDEPLSFKTILESNDLDDAIWALQSIDAPEVTLFAIRCVRQIQHMIKDMNVLYVLDVAESLAIGSISNEELEKAKSIASAALPDPASSDVLSNNRQDASESWFHVYFSILYAKERTIRDAYRDPEYIEMLASWEAKRAALESAQEKDFIDIFCNEEQP